MNLVVIPATKRSFIVANRIRVNRNPKARVKIFSLTGCFSVFGQKVERPNTEHELYSLDLSNRSTDQMIFDKFGGVGVVIVSWSDVHSLLRKSIGKTKMKLDDYASNLFFIPEDDNSPLEKVHPVAVRHAGGGFFDIVVYPVGKTGEWLPGARVFGKIKISC